MAKITISKALVMLHEVWDFDDWGPNKRIEELRRVLKNCANHNVNLHTLALAMKKEMEVDKDWCAEECVVLAAAFSLHNVSFKKPSFL